MSRGTYQHVSYSGGHQARLMVAAFLLASLHSIVFTMALLFWAMCSSLSAYLCWDTFTVGMVVTAISSLKEVKIVNKQQKSFVKDDHWPVCMCVCSLITSKVIKQKKQTTSSKKSYFRSMRFEYWNIHNGFSSYIPITETYSVEASMILKLINFRNIS